MKKSTMFTLSILALCAFQGCSDSNDDNSSSNPQISDITPIPLEFSTHKLALAKANQCDDYRKHVLDSLARNIADRRFGDDDYGYWRDDVVYEVEVVTDESSKADDSKGSESAGEFTTTNVQEAGVDEVDTVKNDANYMYVLRDGDIHVMKIWPAEETNEVTVIPYEYNEVEDHGYTWGYSYSSPTGLLLSGNNLIELSQVETYGNPSDNSLSWYAAYRQYTQVRIFDVSDPKNPKLTKTHQLSGYYSDARLIHGRLFLVSAANPIDTWYEIASLMVDDIPGVPKLVTDDLDWDKNWDKAYKEYTKRRDAWLEKRDENIEKYLPIIRGWLEKKYPNIDTMNWPKYTDGQNVRHAFECNDIYIPATSSQEEGFLIVSEFSGDHFENYKAQALVDSGWLVYASTDNLFVTSTSNGWYRYDCYYGENADVSKCQSYSHIHHFSLGDNESGLKYVNSGEVTGVVDNAFWMSDYNGYLRVVTSPDTWSNAQEGHKLTVLDITTPNTMTITGSVEGFGKNERVYAARMFGDKGYVVTYRNTDPLFTFDLSDPAHPKQVGELKINGYSSYIHPVGQNHLLTIGENADDNGVVNGMHLQLFDVSDLANPVRKYHTMIVEEKSDYNEQGYSHTSAWSEALYNHHAFNYHEGSGLLAIPVNISSYSYKYDDYNSYNYVDFSGMFVYRITADSDFKLIGGVNHYDLMDSHNDRYHWWVNVDRARFYFKDAGVYDQNAYLYTLSNYGLKVSNALKPNETIQSVNY